MGVFSVNFNGLEFRVTATYTETLVIETPRERHSIPVNFREIPGVSDTDHWLGGKSLDREPGSDEVETKEQVLMYFNNRLDEDIGFTQDSDFTPADNTFYYFDREDGAIVYVSSFVATDFEPAISPSGATVVLQGLARKLAEVAKEHEKNG